jgi:membrane fusion protein (multidrug efflux system)
MSSVSRFTRLTLTVAVMAAFAGCGQKPNAQAAGGMPPSEVAVVTIAPERITIANELPGRLEATRIAQVRARVAGIVLKRTFREGSEVKAGDVLFKIDPAPFKAAYDSSAAALARAQATQTQATLKVQRYKPLVEVNAISKQDYDDAFAAQKQADADVASSKAALQTAALNLGYATVTSPISGRIGRALVTEGALVGQSDVTQLATVQQLDPIYVNLTQSSNDLLQLQQAMATGQLKTVGKDKAKVTLVTDDGRPYPVRSPSAPNSRILTAPCCRACMCAPSWNKRSTKPPSWYRNKRSCAISTAPAYWWSMPTTRWRHVRSRPVPLRVTAGSSPTASRPATA